MKSFKRHCVSAALSAVMAMGGMTAVTAVHAEEKKAASAAEQGKKLAFSRKKGNCLACHMIEGGEAPGNIAPPLLAMKARYPEKAKLREQLWDPAIANKETMMPPFGAHGILSEKELDLVVDYIWSL